MPEAPSLLGYICASQPGYNAGLATRHPLHHPARVICGAEGLGREASRRGRQSLARWRAFPSACLWITRQVERFKRYLAAQQVNNTHRREIDAIKQAATAAQTGLEEVGKTHRYAAGRFATTLAVVQALIQTAGGAQPMTPAMGVTLHHLTREYLHDLLAGAENAGAKMIDGLLQRRPPAQIGAEERRRIDQISEVYVQQVQDNLLRKEQIMAKKEPNVLGLAPLTPAGNGVIIYGAAANVNRPPSKTEQRIELETQKHLQVIRNQRLKAEAAAHEIAQIHQQGAKEFLETTDHLAALKETARGKEYQVLVEEFNQRSIQLTAQHLFGIIEVSARNMGMETARPLYREDEPVVVRVVEKRGLLRRLMGD